MKVCLACDARFDTNAWTCPACRNEPALLDGHLAFAPQFALASDGFEAGFFPTLAAAIEEQSFWFLARNDMIVWVIQRFFPAARVALEVGCGTGFVLRAIHEAFPGLVLSGSEIFTAGLRHAARRLPSASLLQMDARRMPFDAEFDFVGAFDVLEHIADDRGVLRELFRAVRPGGGIVLTVPQHAWLWSKSDDAAHHVRRYAERELRDKVSQAGFSVVYTTSFVSILLPLMLVSRLRKKRADASGEVEVLASPLNDAFAAIMWVEHLARRSGVPLKLGGSLLMVARRPASG